MTKLQADIEQYINEKLARGDFHSRDEFTEEAFRVYRELENQHDELRTEIQRRIQRAGQGHYSAPARSPPVLGYRTIYRGEYQDRVPPKKGATVDGHNLPAGGFARRPLGGKMAARARLGWQRGRVDDRGHNSPGGWLHGR